jgi:hypothetical protein
MKKTFLKKFSGASLLSKQETKTITGGYDNGSFTGSSCSYIICPAGAPIVQTNSCYNKAIFAFIGLTGSGSSLQYCFRN